MAFRAPATVGMEQPRQSGSGVRSSHVVVGVVATQLVAKDTARLAVGIKNISGTAIFIGIEGVTVGTGMQLGQNETLVLDTSAPLFAISAAGGETADVIEVIR